MLILFSVWRTDRSSEKFATFSWGKTDNARHCRAADILLPSLSCRRWAGLTILQQPLTFQTYPVSSRLSGRT